MAIAHVNLSPVAACDSYRTALTTINVIKKKKFLPKEDLISDVHVALVAVSLR